MILVVVLVRLDKIFLHPLASKRVLFFSNILY